MEMIPIIGILSSSAMVVLVVYFVTRARQRRVEVQVEMQSRLIDRFGTAPELVQFLHSDAGKQFVSGVSGAPDVLTRERIQGGFTRSIVLTMLGLAFVFLSFFYEDNFAVPAAIVFSLGIGFFLATLVTYKMSRPSSSDDSVRS
jgi:membrane protein implicated in regulation of membrane protease activity